MPHLSKILSCIPNGLISTNHKLLEKMNIKMGTPKMFIGNNSSQKHKMFM